MRRSSETIRVLHVDDEPGFSEMVAEFLERQDDRFDVETATGASEALDWLAENTVDCVVSDYDMPGQDGIEFLEAVREANSDLPFILYTGKGSEEVASEAISAGVTDYLQKESGTSQYEVLGKRVENAVERQRARAAAAETEQRLQTIAENTNDILWKFTADWNELLFINSPYEEIWGRSVDELRDEPQSFLKGIHPNDRPAVKDAMDRLSDGESVDIEYRVNADEDYSRWVWVQGEPVLDATGDVEKVVGFARDITDRKNQEQVLAEQRADLRLFERAVEGSTDLIGAVDTEYNFIFANERYRTFHGYSENDIVGQPAAKVIGDPWESEVKPRVDRALAGEVVQYDSERTGADGEDHLFDIRYFPLTDENETITGVVGTMRDITERKEGERELRESAQRYRALFDSSSAVIFEEDFSEVKQHLDSISAEEDDLEAYFESNPEAIPELMSRVQIINVTRRALEYYNADTKTELVENLTDRFTDEAYEANKEIALRLADGETEFRVKSVSELPNGKRKHEVLDVAVPDAYADDYSRVYLTVTDITGEVERERTLERLQESARLLVTAETSDEVAQEVAEAANDILGYAYPVVRYREEEQLVPAYAVAELHEEADTIPTYRIGEGLAGQAFASGEVRVYDDVRDVDDGYDRGGTRSVMYVPIGDHGVLSVADTEASAFDETDITFVELLASHARTALDLLDQRQALQQQNDRLDEFASVVSHDLRNPLSVAEGRLELAAEDCDSEHLESVEQALDRMETLIDDVLTLSQAGETVGESEPVRLPGLIDPCWDTVRTESAELILETDTTIQADRSRLQALLENLFRNAIEHAGPTVTVKVGDLSNGFYVEDDGPGIPEDERQDVLETGYSTREDGTGIGLGIVREIVEAHGWNLEVTSSTDGGARFEISGVQPK